MYGFRIPEMWLGGINVNVSPRIRVQLKILSQLGSDSANDDSGRLGRGCTFLVFTTQSGRGHCLQRSEPQTS